MRNCLLNAFVTMVLACTCVIMCADYAFAQDSKDSRSAQSNQERLVLMPLRVSEENKSMQSAMETALVQGLQQKYVVFQGEQVAQKAREIFLKESRNKASNECNEIRCLQNIAEAFQAELIATANVTKIDGGYLLSLSIQNIFDNKAVFSNAMPCRSCDGFQVVEKLKLLGNETINSAQLTAASTADLPTNNGAIVSENALWDEAQKSNKISDYRAYLGQYPRGKYSSTAEGRIFLLGEQARTELTQQDQNAWTNATNASTETGYQEYLNRFPQGLYIVQAKARIKKLQDGHQKTVTEIKPGSVFRDCAECPEMVILPAGEFNMGSNNVDKDEQPVHRVSIAKMFAIGKTEITQGQWRALMSTTTTKVNGENRLGELVGQIKHILPKHKHDVTESHFNTILETSPEYLKNCGDNCTAEQKRAIRESEEGENTVAPPTQIVVDNNPSYFKNCGDDCPVEQVSWMDAQKFIQKLMAKTSKHYRLPTEAEWEYACRGGNAKEYCGGDQVDSVAWYGGYTSPLGNGGKSTHSVATLSANGFGLYDMSGNVWEWVEDNYHASYNNAPTDGNAWMGETTRHVLRGGAWNSKLQEVRTANRGKVDPSGRGNVGFRVVRVLP